MVSSEKAFENAGRNIHKFRNQLRILETYLEPHWTEKYKENKKEFERKLEENKDKEGATEELNRCLGMFSNLMALLAELRWLDHIVEVDEISDINPVIRADED